MRKGDVVRELLLRLMKLHPSFTRRTQGNRKTFEDAVKDMQAATEWLIEKGGASTDDGLAGLPYLRMFGTTVGGWLCAVCVAGEETN